MHPRWIKRSTSASGSSGIYGRARSKRVDALVVGGLVCRASVGKSLIAAVSLRRATSFRRHASGAGNGVSAAQLLFAFLAPLDSFEPFCLP